MFPKQDDHLYFQKLSVVFGAISVFLIVATALVKVGGARNFLLMLLAPGILLMCSGFARLAWTLPAMHRWRAGAGLLGALVFLPLATWGLFNWGWMGDRIVEAWAQQKTIVHRAFSDSPTPNPPAAAPHQDHEKDEKSTLPQASPVPAWTKLDSRTIHGTEVLVVCSEQFATVEEAERALSQKVGKTLQQDYQKKWRPLFSPRWIQMPGREQLEPVISQHYVEVIQRDFGTFTAPMYRVWWEVTLSPTTRAEVAPFFKRQISDARLELLGGGVALLSLWGGCLWLFGYLSQLVSKPCPRSLALFCSVPAVWGFGAFLVHLTSMM